jgi:ferredoxin like protein
MDIIPVEKRLTLVKFNIHPEPHILILKEKCKDCDRHYCIKACPAGLYSLDENGELTFNYEGCFECGTCRYVCPEEAIIWRYPPGGYGVHFQFG